MRSKINELIKLIDETIKKSQSEVYQKQIKSYIDKLTDCNNVGKSFVKDAENLNRAYRKVTKTKAVFPNNASF